MSDDPGLGELAADVADIDDSAPQQDRSGRPPHMAPRAEADDQGVTVWNYLTEEQLDGDFSNLIRFFGYDPDTHEVVPGSVRMSKWQQSKRLEDGRRDMVWLYSYSLRLTRVSGASEVDVDAHRARVQAWAPLPRRSPGMGLGTPSTLHVGWSDWQLGKGQNDPKDSRKGFEATSDRVLASFEATLERLRELRRIGRNVNGLVIANMGDPFEGCGGAYANQLATTELTLRQQLNLCLDLWETGVRALAPEFEKVTFLSVLCNHTEWTRPVTGGKAMTDDSDSGGAFLAEALRRILSGRPDLAHLSWVIPQGEMVVTADVSGVRCAYTHGHKAPDSKAELEWLQAQSLRTLREEGAEPRLWFTAHRHHFHAKDYGPWWRFQHPSLDTGSKWIGDLRGVFSTPGTLTCLVGEHAEAGGLLRDGGKGWSDLAVL